MPFPFANPDPAIDPHLVVDSGAPKLGGFSQINPEGVDGLFKTYFEGLRGEGAANLPGVAQPAPAPAASRHSSQRPPAPARARHS